MVEGAALLAAQAPVSPGELARRVASPGGTTQRGLDVLDADQALGNLIEATLRAARDRGAEMAAEARKSD
jgi:pyrroline-5-carboxylate reductase